KIIWAERLSSSKSVSKEDVADIQRWLGYFQHERLIHLLVTMFVALCDMISVVMLLLYSSYATIALSVLLSVLFVFYIIHYYTLENGVQKLYKLTDELIAIVAAKAR
ncbi:MAG: hypothetical protein LBS73_03280, partial [Campylobacteraceae bacterium]|nr:hypothetical protein [Campylobacteraceae bacterium]